MGASSYSFIQSIFQLILYDFWQTLVFDMDLGDLYRVTLYSTELGPSDVMLMHITLLVDRLFGRMSYTRWYTDVFGSPPMSSQPCRQLKLLHTNLRYLFLM